MEYKVTKRDQELLSKWGFSEEADLFIVYQREAMKYSMEIAENLAKHYFLKAKAQPEETTLEEYKRNESKSINTFFVDIERNVISRLRVLRGEVTE